MDASKIYVGVDPSMSTGFVIMRDDRVIFADEIILKNKSKSSTAEILQYGRDIVQLIPGGAFIAIEGFAFSARGDAVSTQYGIGFAIRYAMIDSGIKYYEPTPSALKKFITGKGTSKKEIMIKEVYKRWGYEHDSNNVIDAYALARYAIAHEEGVDLGAGSKGTRGKSKNTKAKS